MTPTNPDGCLDLLADGRRRRIIQQLRRERNETTTIDDLVDRLRGSAREGEDVDREHLQIQLQHTHLPKLANHNIVEYDIGTGVVEYRPDERVEEVLDSLPEEALALHP